MKRRGIMAESSVRRYQNVSLEQLKLLIDFMSQHVELAAGTCRTLEARHESKILWAEVAKLLNGYKGGIRRPSHGWSKYWSDFKIKLKNKLIELKRKQLGMIKKDVKPMTKLEKRALNILGPNFEKKYIGENGGGFEDVNCDPLPPEIKQETMTSANGYYKAHNGSDRLSESGSDNSGQHSDDEVEDGDQSSDEPVINNIYPKWLVDVEKKRAEAELRRAKAEECRAEVAIKNAEAALTQAEALKKLSEAAEKQANAIQRIVVILENRTREDILNL